MISSEENELLTQDFSEEKIRTAVFNSYARGAPGPDGFPFLFYQQFWGTIKTDLMSLVSKFCYNTLDLYRLNFAMITLIPKEADATSIKKYRPIALTNCSFKEGSHLFLYKLFGNYMYHPRSIPSSG